MKEVKEALARKFDIKDMGRLHYFLGIKVSQDKKTGDVGIGQPAYAENLLKKFGMDATKPVSTPVSAEAKFVKATEEDRYIDQQLYGSVSYRKSSLFVRWHKARHHICCKYHGEIFH